MGETKLKYLLHYEGKGNKQSSESESEGLYPFYSCSNKVKYTNNPIFMGKKILISTGGQFYAFLTNGKFDVSTDVLIHSVKEEVEAGFLMHFLEAKSNDINDTMFKGMGIKHLDRGLFYDMKLNLPDLATQQRIAAFLDANTAKIDSLSDELTKFKANLQLQKRSLVSECVTKGVPVLINPTFIRTKLKYLSKVQSGSGFPNDMQGSMDYAIPFLKVKSLKTSDDKGVISTYEDTVSDEIAKKLGATIIPAYSLIFAKVGEALKLNRFRIIANDSCIDNNMGALSFNSDVNARFMYYVMNLNDVKKFLNSGPIPSMNINRFMNSEIYIPPLGEQQKIADYLDAECAKIDSLISEIDNQIGLLKTYRKSLINEVVTGKVEV